MRTSNLTLSWLNCLPILIFILRVTYCKVWLSGEVIWCNMLYLALPSCFLFLTLLVKTRDSTLLTAYITCGYLAFIRLMSLTKESTVCHQSVKWWHCYEGFVSWTVLKGDLFFPFLECCCKPSCQWCHSERRCPSGSGGTFHVWPSGHDHFGRLA
jgi:hypothetical protein